MKRLIWALTLAIAVAGCGGEHGGNGNPTAPDSGQSITSIRVTSTPIGNSFQLTATASMSDQTTRNITSLANWDSSNPSVATVSTTGLVIIKTSGEVDVHASYSGVVGALHLFLRTQTSTLVLSGFAREMGSDTPLGGVLVQMVTGPDTGISTTTDQSGAFRFAALHPGQAKAQFSKQGYVTYQTLNFTFTQDTTMYAWLKPVSQPGPDGLVSLSY